MQRGWIRHERRVRRRDLRVVPEQGVVEGRREPLALVVTVDVASVVEVAPERAQFAHGPSMVVGQPVDQRERDDRVRVVEISGAERGQRPIEVGIVPAQRALEPHEPVDFLQRVEVQALERELLQLARRGLCLV